MSGLVFFPCVCVGGLILVALWFIGECGYCELREEVLLRPCHMCKLEVCGWICFQMSTIENNECGWAKGETETVHRKKENCAYHYNLHRPLRMEKERGKKATEGGLKHNLS